VYAIIVRTDPNSHLDFKIFSIFSLAVCTNNAISVQIVFAFRKASLESVHFGTFSFRVYNGMDIYLFYYVKDLSFIFVTCVSVTVGVTVSVRVTVRVRVNPWVDIEQQVLKMNVKHLVSA